MNFKMTNEYPMNADTIVCFVKTDATPKFNSEFLQTAYDTAYEGDTFAYEKGTVKNLRMKTSQGFVNLIAAQFDSEDPIATMTWKGLVPKIVGIMTEVKSTVVYFDNLSDLTFAEKEDLLRQFASTLPLVGYKFDKYKSDKKDMPEREVFIWGDETYQKDLDEGASIAKAVGIAKNMVNEPANVLSPQEMADRVVSYGAEFGFEVEILEREQCEELGMGAFLSVAKASASAPKFIIMRYNGGAEGEVAKGIVGKGICYDSGGLYVKKGEYMHMCAGDMGGAGAVIGAMCAVAENKLKKNVIAVVAACENLIDGEGYRNGDIITSMSGKTIYVSSTDAEGRLTMADAITYLIRKEKVDSIVELSTLTGSCGAFFGPICAPVYTMDEGLFNAFSDNMKLSDEKIWRMPTFPEYRMLVDYEIADLNNTSPGVAGGIAAGVFLDSFREETPFMHIDIAGASVDMAGGSKRMGASGYGVKSLYYYLK